MKISGPRDDNERFYSRRAEFYFNRKFNEIPMWMLEYLFTPIDGNFILPLMEIWRYEK